MGFLKSSPGDWEGQAVILVKIQVSYIDGWGGGVVRVVSGLNNTALLYPALSSPS